MKTIITSLFLIWIILLVQIQSKGQQLIQNDTIWASDTIKIYNDIVVEYPATLTIQPGVYVEFQGNYSIEVAGKIKVIGSAGLPITFNVADTNSFSDTATIAGGWGGIKFIQNQNDTSTLNYCNFYYGKAVQPGTDPLNSSNENLKGGAIYVNGYANVLIENSIFSNNTASFSGGAIWAINSQTLSIRNCIFSKNHVFDIGGGLWVNNVNKIEILNNIFKENIAFRTGDTPLGTYITGGGSALGLGSQTIQLFQVMLFLTIWVQVELFMKHRINVLFTIMQL
jgi:hypothetical protein